MPANYVPLRTSKYPTNSVSLGCIIPYLAHGQKTRLVLTFTKEGGLVRRVDRKKQTAVVDDAIDAVAEAPFTLSGTSSVFGLGLLNSGDETLDVSNAPTSVEQIDS